MRQTSRRILVYPTFLIRLQRCSVFTHRMKRGTMFCFILRTRCARLSFRALSHYQKYSRNRSALCPTTKSARGTVPRFVPLPKVFAERFRALSHYQKFVRNDVFPRCWAIPERVAGVPGEQTRPESCFGHEPPFLQYPVTFRLKSTCAVKSFKHMTLPSTQETSSCPPPSTPSLSAPALAD